MPRHHFNAQFLYTAKNTNHNLTAPLLEEALNLTLKLPSNVIEKLDENRAFIFAYTVMERGPIIIHVFRMTGINLGD